MKLSMIEKLFYRLSHNLDTSECEPYGRNESWLIYVNSVESYHEYSSSRQEYRLSYARMDSADIHIASIVDFFKEE